MEGLDLGSIGTILAGVAALFAVVISLLSWATSASKSRVDNLVTIINAQSRRIDELEADLREARQDIEFYQRVISCEGVDLAPYRVSVRGGVG